MLRNKLRLAAVAAAAALALAGCTTGGGGGGDEPLEVTVWHYWDGTNADTFDAMADEFNEANPDIEITTSNVPEPGLPHQAPRIRDVRHAAGHRDRRPGLGAADQRDRHPGRPQRTAAR